MKNAISSEHKKNIIIAVILVIVALISFFALAKVFSDPKSFEGTISVLDDKKNTVAKLSAISIGAASAIDLIPGEAGSSISKELVNLGGYFVLLFAAIYLEKILISIGGYVAFKVLIPIGLFLIAGFVMLRKEYLRAFGIRLITIGLVLFLIVPSSVWVSGVVDKTHDMSKQQAIQEIGEETNLLEKSSEETAAAAETEENEKDTEDTSLLGKIKNSGSAVLGTIKNEGSNVLASAKEIPKKMNELLDNLIEEIAYFFVSICVIPIVVLILLVILLKQLLGFSGVAAIDSSALVKAMKQLSLEKKEQEE